MDSYNGCFFAYGQTGSGKSFSVTGGTEPNQKGVLPRFCDGMFREIIQRPHLEIHVCISYLEIYNEQARDLLRPQKAGAKENLEIRQHPTVGVFVPDLTENVVKSLSDVESLMDF